MPSIQTFIEVVLLVGVAYLLVHQRAANAYEFATFRVLPAWNLSLVVIEFAGVCLRRFHKLPTYAALDDAHVVLGLDPATATSEQVRQAYERLSREMSKRPRAYPDSQHEAVLGLAWERSTRARLGETLAFVRQNWKKFSSANG